MKTCWITIAAVAMLAAAPSAQWIKYPTPGIPRTADGKPNLAAPAPKLADGKPDLSGLWLTQGIYIGNIAKDLKADEVPFQPWAAELYKQRVAKHTARTTRPGAASWEACHGRPPCRTRSRSSTPPAGSC